MVFLEIIYQCNLTLFMVCLGRKFRENISEDKVLMLRAKDELE